MNYLERRRLADMARREFAGENLWTDNFSTETRNRFLYLIEECTGGNKEFLISARARILKSEGWTSLVKFNYSPEYDFIQFAQQCDDEDFPVVIEEVFSVMSAPGWQAYLGITPNLKMYCERTIEILNSDRINFDFIDGQMVPKQDQVLHADIILPTIRLLGSDPKWKQVEDGYLKGLEEIRREDPGDAITDFASSLEDFLKKVGAEGDTLGQLVSSGIAKQLIKTEDRKLFDWVATQRNNGEAHGGGGTENLADAWLVANVVGSIIVRWSQGS